MANRGIIVLLSVSVVALFAFWFITSESSHTVYQQQAQLVTSNYCSATTCTISNIQVNDQLFVWAKGNSNAVVADTIELREDGIMVDVVDVGTAELETPFSTLYRGTATDTSNTYTVVSVGGNTLSNVDIMIQVFR